MNITEDVECIVATTTDLPVPMSLEKPEVASTQTNEKEEVEMEDIFEDPILDIDDGDSRNPLVVTEYVDDIYSYYRRMELLNFSIISATSSIDMDDSIFEDSNSPIESGLTFQSTNEKDRTSENREQNLLQQSTTNEEEKKGDNGYFKYYDDEKIKESLIGRSVSNVDDG